MLPPAPHLAPPALLKLPAWNSYPHNVAERAIRPTVLLRKTSLGSQSERGSRFVERMHTASATLRRTGRSLHNFVVGIAHAVHAGQPAPRLLG
ncbi:MAG: transposase [bacterium]|nr:transposase [bacterium]